MTIIMKKPILFLGGLFAILVALSVVRVSLVNNISTHGIELVDLQARIEEYRKQNELLKEQYLQAASFTHIEKEAKKMGFAPTKNQMNMAAPPPLAKR